MWTNKDSQGLLSRNTSCCLALKHVGEAVAWRRGKITISCLCPSTSSGVGGDRQTVCLCPLWLAAGGRQGAGMDEANKRNRQTPSSPSSSSSSSLILTSTPSSLLTTCTSMSVPSLISLALSLPTPTLPYLTPTPLSPFSAPHFLTMWMDWEDGWTWDLVAL